MFRLDDEFPCGWGGGAGEGGGGAFEFCVFPAVAAGGEGGDAAAHEFPANQDDELLELGVAEVMKREAGHSGMMRKRAGKSSPLRASDPLFSLDSVPAVSQDESLRSVLLHQLQMHRSNDTLS